MSFGVLLNRSKLRYQIVNEFYWGFREQPFLIGNFFLNSDYHVNMQWTIKALKMAERAKYSKFHAESRSFGFSNIFACICDIECCQGSSHRIVCLGFRNADVATLFR